jgi:hypothetical protein
VAVGQLRGGDERVLGLSAHMRDEGGFGVGRGTRRGRRGGSVAAHAWQPQERSAHGTGVQPATPTWTRWGRTARGCSTLCVSSAEEEKGKKMRLTCGPREFKLNFRNLKSNQSCFDPKRTLPSSKFFK